ncbi:1,4-alpha-glucan branching protein GlgB [Clostridium tarantellae]|uniref:1,4-alpha-glucan branching enzyme GlgB n=1 Tax=Clostridium tarantellae TaxID=39493 RepID=A0A6I1MM45_9CLOT|nr:1,4-alpha-glucan branching protein GlgB [Clostridium tarantellae]MPQ43312.1 1,4-alpha-glucan branching protein GlgB [Clostridium tarantellae]
MVKTLEKKELVKKDSSNKNVKNNEVNKSKIKNINNKSNDINKSVKASSEKVVKQAISDLDIYLFHEGKHYQCYEFLGAHFVTEKRKKGVRFTTWAPKAKEVIVVGEFTSWQLKEEYKMEKISETGIWSLFIPGLKDGQTYKYAVKSMNDNLVFKFDPYALKSQLRPKTDSVLVNIEKYKWKDRKWINKRKKGNIYELPMNIYELHLGSWKTKDDKFMTYDELSIELPKYIKKLGYTHVEFMPLNEHPLDASWGYQSTGYYSVTSRYGDLNSLKNLIQELHKNDIGVILDWVPGHFCKDEYGLYKFDGSNTYEYEEGWKAENKGWGTCNFDLGRPEVKSFLISNALFWLKEFHIDGLRVDAVSNMIYLNYGRDSGEWIPNKYGGTENLQGIQFIKELNLAIKNENSGFIVIAEESTSYPNVTKSVDNGGLGFNFKWNMGWMNDTLKYIEKDAVHRKYHHNNLTFAMMYNHSEKFILPISHDEVVHGKKSLVDKMWGDYWNKFAGLRLYIAYMFGHPGKKLLFMGSEFAQFIEWREYEELEWKLIDEFDMHRNTHNFFKEMNTFYIENKALWQLDYDLNGFQWIDADNKDQSILIFIRRGKKEEDTLIFICNFTPVVYYNFDIGVPYLWSYKQVFNTDSFKFGGSNQIIDEILYAKKKKCHNQPYKLTIKVPPMAVLILGKNKSK